MAEEIRRIVRQLELASQELDLIVLRTKTGVEREAQTGAQIHILESIRILLEIA